MEVFLSSLGSDIRFVTDSYEVLAYVSDVWERQIPDYRVAATLDHNPDGQISFQDGDDSQFLIDAAGREARVVMPLSGLHWMDLEFLVMAMFNNLYMARQIVCTNGAAVTTNGNAVLLLGDYGSGKSITAFELYRSGLEVVAYDRVALGFEASRPATVGGTCQLRLRPGCIELYFPFLTHSIAAGHAKDPTELWLNQVTVANDASCSSNKVPASAICSVYQVHVVTGADRDFGFVTPLTSSAYLPAALYRYLTRYVMGYELAFLSLSRLFPRVETTKMREFRWDLANAMASNVPCLKVEGSLDYVSRVIRNNLEHPQ